MVDVGRRLGNQGKVQAGGFEMMEAIEIQRLMQQVRGSNDFPHNSSNRNCSGVAQTCGPMPVGFHSQEYPRNRSKPLSRRDMR